MNELQGALGLAQLRKLDTIIAEQKKNKQAIKDVLSKCKGIKFRDIPDPDGDTATFLAFNLSDENAAAQFQKSLSGERVDTVCFKKNLWHYLPNWEHFLARSTANSKKYPFTDPSYKGKVNYERSTIPRAEDILGRTLVMNIPVKMPKERFVKIKEGIEKAAQIL
jgi:8-amino-3,8-dideoxy-alpha-D-manno-octulosonate transaminase